jgi:hypothetical protein
MHASHFQLSLVAALSLGLGFTLASSSAVGYPAGAAVSYGINPVQSFTGVASGTDSIELDAIPSGQDFIVTDVSLMAKSLDTDCMDMIDARLSTATRDIARYDVATRYCYSASCYSDGREVHRSMTTGLKVEAGETLSLHTSVYNSFTYAGCSSSRDTSVKYTISGYYVQP